MAPRALLLADGTFENDSRTLIDTLFMKSQPVNSMIAYSQSPTFQPVNSSSMSIPRSNAAIDPALIADLQDFGANTSTWQATDGNNFSVLFDGTGSCLWPMQTQLDHPTDNDASNGFSPPSQQGSPYAATSSQAFSDNADTIDPNEILSQKKEGDRKRVKLGGDGDGKSKGRKKSRKNSRVRQDERDLDPEDEVKREKFLERNRVAASKCRQKKKEWTNNLEDRARDLATQRQMLNTYVSVLKNELLMLKCKCLEHSDCGCERIRNYLKHTISTLPPAPAGLYNIEDDESRKSSVASSTGDTLTSPVFTSPSLSSTPKPDPDFLRLERDMRSMLDDSALTYKNGA